MAKERKCENWLSSFAKWTVPRSEAPEAFLLWGGLFVLSAALKRRVYIGREYLGGWECTPHLYVFLVGPPGLRKTTSMGFAIDLLSQAPNVTQSPTITNITALIDSLLKSPDSSIYMTIEEFGDIILKGGFEMYEFLTSMFDGKKHIEQKTMIRGSEFIEKPCISLLAATTPQWISGNMPQSVIGGGFASRVIFVYEDDIREDKLRLFYKKREGYLGVNVDELNNLEKDLVSDLAHINSKIEGKFDIEESAMDWLEDWYKKEKKKAGNNNRMQGYLVRKHVHVLKVAMLIHIAYSDVKIITLEDFQNAIGIVELTEKQLPKVFIGVGKNPYTFDTQDIIKFISENPGVERSRLLREFENVATPAMLSQLIEGALEMTWIRSEYDQSNGMKQTFFLGEGLK